MRKTRTISAASLPVLFSIFLSVSPGTAAPSEDDVLATVDGEPAVTYDDVAYYVSKMGRRPGAPITATDVEDIVETLVEADILVREAQARGLAEDAAVQKELATFTSSVLREKMGATLLDENAVSEEEIRAFYEKGRKWRRISRILAKDKAEAEAAYRELESGRPWDEVADEYSIERSDEERAGSYPVPLVYDGRAASITAYETPVGAYTPPVPDNDGIRWDIYCIDKIIHGAPHEYEEGRAYAAAGLEVAKLAEAYASFLEEARLDIPIERNEDMWRDLQSLPFTEFFASWGNAEAVASNVGGVIISGKEFVAIIHDYYGAGADGLDLIGQADPRDFAYVTGRLLEKIEGGALLEAAARREGMDRTPAFRREYEIYRKGLLTRKLIAAEFDPTLPQPTDEQARAYYESHLGELQVPEKVELYVVAMPDPKELRTFYERIAGGGDLVLEGQAYNRARAEELTDMYEQPPELPPEEESWLGVVQIYREPNPREPDRGLAAELRPRAFPFTQLKELSDIFQLPDGRWTFYAPIYYQPFRQKEFDEVNDDCKRQIWKEYLAGEEIERLSREWLTNLRSRHQVETKPALFGETADRLNGAE